MAGLEPATEGSLQISGRTHKPLGHRCSHTQHGLSKIKQGGIGGTVVGESTLRSAGILLSRIRASLPAPWPKGWPKSLRSPCCGLAVYQNQLNQLCYIAKPIKKALVVLEAYRPIDNFGFEARNEELERTKLSKLNYNCIDIKRCTMLPSAVCTGTDRECITPSEQALTEVMLCARTKHLIFNRYVKMGPVVQTSSSPPQEPSVRSYTKKSSDSP
ncbi:hypothetical protein PoB_004461000 [Plakobranchus ocellatus]|uniref:Uncharacterized protein n=1 Tax=Plakobranchus ocellatus TaxID=259542 RepID=A0AAV4BG75_9GAST|nr:hypothetical protein PoB_004461000 [Plakobranchus ocellatus]